MGSSDDGDAHTLPAGMGIDTSGNFGVGFLPLLGEPVRSHSLASAFS
jgi:hypothetical protein